MSNLENPVRMPPPDWPDVHHSEFHVVGGIRWHVQRQGAGPTLLLVHGTGGSTHSWAGCTPALAAHFHLVSIDLPGHGFTQVPAEVERRRNPYALAAMSRAVGELLTHLGERPTVAAGHSAGVSVLLRMVVDGQIAPARLVGFCPALIAPPAWYVAFVAPLLGLVVESRPVAGGAAWLASGTRIVEQMLGSTGSPLSAVQLARYRALCAKPEHVHAALTMMSRWDLPALRRDLGALRTPVDLVAGRQDRWIPCAPLERAAQGIPGMTWRVEEGGHLLPEERPEVVIDRLLEASRR